MSDNAGLQDSMKINTVKIDIQLIFYKFFLLMKDKS